jgi:hypothetical protein
MSASVTHDCGRWTYDFTRLENSRKSDSDNENQSHGPVNGTVVESVELLISDILSCVQIILTIESKINPADPMMQKQIASQSIYQLIVDNGIERRAHTKDLLPGPEINRQSIDMPQPSLGE